VLLCRESLLDTHKRENLLCRDSHLDTIVIPTKLLCRESLLDTIVIPTKLLCRESLLDTTIIPAKGLSSQKRGRESIQGGMAKRSTAMQNPTSPKRKQGFIV
jgi:hypothetical protein